MDSESDAAAVTVDHAIDIARLVYLSEVSCKARSDRHH